MLDNYERGRKCAEAFISNWKEFDQRSFKKICDDLAKRTSGRRTFRLTSPAKLRFFAGISSVFLWEPSLKLDRADYAQVIGVGEGTLSTLLKEDPSLEEETLGMEEKKGNGPKRSGRPARYILYALRDMKFRESMRDERFYLGFFDRFHEAWTNGEFIASGNLREYASQLQAVFKSGRLRKASKAYLAFIRDTQSNVRGLWERRRSSDQRSKYGSDFCDYRSPSRRILDQREKEIDEFLAMLRITTESALRNVRHSKHQRRFAEAVLSVDVPAIRSIWSDYLVILVMLYFVSPWSTDEFAGYTGFFKTAPECYEHPTNDVSLEHHVS